MTLGATTLGARPSKAKSRCNIAVLLAVSAKPYLCSGENMACWPACSGCERQMFCLSPTTTIAARQSSWSVTSSLVGVNSSPVCYGLAWPLYPLDHTGAQNPRINLRFLRPPNDGALISATIVYLLAKRSECKWRTGRSCSRRTRKKPVPCMGSARPGPAAASSGRGARDMDRA